MRDHPGPCGTMRDHAGSYGIIRDHNRSSFPAQSIRPIRRRCSAIHGRGLGKDSKDDSKEALGDVVGRRPDEAQLQKRINEPGTSNQTHQSQTGAVQLHVSRQRSPPRGARVAADSANTTPLRHLSPAADSQCASAVWLRSDSGAGHEPGHRQVQRRCQYRHTNPAEQPVVRSARLAG